MIRVNDSTYIVDHEIELLQAAGEFAAENTSYDPKTHGSYPRLVEKSIDGEETTCRTRFDSPHMVQFAMHQDQTNSTSYDVFIRTMLTLQETSEIFHALIRAGGSTGMGDDA